MQHGTKNMANEKKLLREINSSQKMEIGTTIDELDAPVQIKKSFLVQKFRVYIYFLKWVNSFNNFVGIQIYRLRR